MRAERAAATNQARPLAELSLQDFIPSITPRWSPPKHLTQLTNVFERIKRGEAVRVLLSVPPQHGKTETELHGIAQLLLRFPERSNAFVSYGAPLALSKSALARDYALAAGVRIRRDSNAKGEWLTRGGGGLRATGIGGPLTGQPVSGLLIVDDPHKNREEAESAVKRDKVFDWFTSTAMTRVHLTTSVLVVHTRWHEDDLIGRLSKQVGSDGKPVYEVINIPAVNAEGEALWPEARPLKLLDAARLASEYDWWSMYMGSPRPKGGALFGDVHFFTKLPTGFRLAIGVDLAYTAKTHADYSVAVVMAESDGVYYVIGVIRMQVLAPEFGAALKALALKHPDVPMLAYVAGVEKGSVDFMRLDGVPLRSRSATSDKFIRAQPFAGAWNAGLVRIPVNRGALWLPGTEKLPAEMRGLPVDWVGPYISELKNFTGIKDKRDDQVDASAPAFDRLQRATRTATGGALIISADADSMAIG